MTRPIYEPSLPRRDAELGFGSDQLFRRPAPLTNTKWAWLYNTNRLTSAAGTFYNLFSAGDGATGNTTDDSGMVPSTANARMECDSDGIYLATVNIIWSASFGATEVNLRMSWANAVGGSVIPNAQQQFTQGEGWQSLTQVFFIQYSGSGVLNLQATVNQQTGVDQTVSSASLRVVRLSTGSFGIV